MNFDNNDKRTQPYFYKGGKKRKNYDGDPDWDYLGSAGLKTIKAQHALTSYEQKGEPAYDEMGGYKPGQDKVDLKHHEELKKNLKANQTNERIMRSKAVKDYVNQHPNNSIEARIYAQNQINGARDYATKIDNKQKAYAYRSGIQGFSMSKNRENRARERDNKPDNRR